MRLTALLRYSDIPISKPQLTRSKKVFCLALNAMLLALSFPVEAQQQSKIPKIGWLGARPAVTATEQRELFWREFRALGYVEGKNIAFEYRYADNKLDRLPVLADELVRHKVDVLVTTSTAEALSRQKCYQHDSYRFSRYG